MPSDLVELLSELRAIRLWDLEYLSQTIHDEIERLARGGQAHEVGGDQAHSVRFATSLSQCLSLTSSRLGVSHP
jgi:hypothetical protein